MAIACRHREQPLPKFSAFGNRERTTCAIKGPAAGVSSTILQRRPFLDFVGEKLEAPVRLVSLRKGKIVASNGRMNALVQVRGARRSRCPSPSSGCPSPSCRPTCSERSIARCTAWQSSRPRRAAARG